MDGEDIRSVKRRHSPDLMGREGVSGFGIERDAGGNEVFVVHVSTDDPGVLAQLPREIEGYPVRVVHSGPFRKLSS